MSEYIFEDIKENETKLYKMASLRVHFKVHLTVFILVNLLCWLVWFFVFKAKNNASLDEIATSNKTLHAVLFLSLSWLVFIIGHYFIAFHWSKSMVDKELNRVKKELARKNKALAKLKEKNNSLS
jgi:hypothetical protein